MWSEYTRLAKQLPQLPFLDHRSGVRRNWQLCLLTWYLALKRLKTQAIYWLLERSSLGSILTELDNCHGNL